MCAGLFFVEAGAMGLLGGVLGVAMGWLIGRALTIGTNAYLKRQELPAIDISSIHWWMVALAHWSFIFREPRGGNVSGVAGRAAEPRRGTAV